MLGWVSYLKGKMAAIPLAQIEAASSQKRAQFEEEGAVASPSLRSSAGYHWAGRIGEAGYMLEVEAGGTAHRVGAEKILSYYVRS